MKRKILRSFPYGRITVLSVDMDNPINVFHFAKRIRHILKRLDVLYLNNSVVNIESMDWNVMYETLRAGSIGYFFTTGKSLSLYGRFICRARPGGKYMITPANLGVGDNGFGIEFCQQILSPFILVFSSFSLS